MSTDLPFISYGRQSIDQQDIEAVIAVLKSDYLTQGPAITAFEAGLKSVTGAQFVSVMSNATAALHVACLALEVGSGDRVWTSPNSFVASANCALYCGAAVDFVDIDPVSLNMSVAALVEKLDQAERDGSLPKVVIPVHFAGESCDMAEIGTLAKKYGFRVIEDASHAIGGRYGDNPVGSSEYSDITVFSFHPVKIVTTAEGGAASTNDPELGRKLAELRTHGITRDPAQMINASEGAWYYEQTSLGLNYRMTDLQAALGLSQLDRLEPFIAKRHLIGDRYDDELAALPLTLPVRQSGRRSALHLYPIQVKDVDRRKAVFDKLRSAQIGVNVHYIPIHLQPYYQALGFKSGDFPAAEHYYAGAISIPMHPSMSDDDQLRVIGALKQALI